MVSDAEKKIITSPYRKYLYSIEFLDKNENTLSEALVDVISGSVNFDAASNNRRSFDITLRNLDKQYIPSPESVFWINHKIKLKAGYESLNGTQILYNQGVYVLGNPSLFSNPVQKEISFQGLDKMSLLNGTIAGELKTKYQIPIGIRLDTAVKLVLQESGENKFIIDECTITTPYTIEIESASNYCDILDELALISGDYEYFFDQNGYFRWRKGLKPEDYNTTPSSWDYNTNIPTDGTVNLYLDSVRELQWNDIRNSIIVYGYYDSDTGIQYFAQSMDSTGSELSVDAIGERVKVLEFSELTSNTLCKYRSDYELLQLIKSQEKTITNIIPNYSHLEEDLISLTDEANGCNGHYLIQGISYPIGYDTNMTLSLWQVRDLRSI
jgi:hypothetical protein